MKSKIKSLFLFIRFQHYRVAIFFASIILVIIFILNNLFILPLSNTETAQTGFSIIAQILGVLLGALVVLIILLIDQKQQAEHHLISEYYSYRKRMQDNISIIKNSRDDILKHLEKGEIKLDDYLGYPDGSLSKSKFKDIYINLTSLFYFLKTAISNKLEKEFKKLNIPANDQDEILFGKALLSEYEPARFLKLFGDALDVNFLAPYCSNESSDFAIEIYQEFSQKGIFNSINKFEKSKNVLGSKMLSLDIFLIIITIVGSVFALFGLIPEVKTCSIFNYIIYSINFLFFLCLFITLFLIDKMLKQ
ncbi:MAG: hypothetical protein AMJ90_04020 [candidate division Zixibacteria bacterium SM23_73_2]|nr:MAG: hypothetical protein AMJ90_04020 [candidate division Zixibacteria bacterium SM23_73_2]